jgi:hypothetical protein
MSDRITGGCLCGQVRYEIKVEPRLQLLCHCSSCRKHTGSAFSMSALVPRDEIEMAGPLKTYLDKGDSGNEIKRVFCPNCGSSLFSEVAARPDSLALKAGTIDDPSWFKPRVNLWTDSALPWVPIDPECKNFPRNAG